MSLELSGTTGVKGVAGSVAAPSIVGDDTNTGISFPAADTIKFSTGGVERMSITNSGVSVGGKIRQVLQTFKTDTTSATSQDQWDDISGLSVSITPASTSNKILVTANLNVSWSSGGYIALRLERGGSAIGVADTAGSRTSGFHGTYKVSDSSYYIHPVSVEFLDSPNSTSALTYNVAWFNPTSEASVRYLNRTVDDANGDYRFRTVSSITAKEVAA